MSQAWRKWTPAVVAVVVVAGVAIAVPAAANASVSLPTKTPAEVLQLVRSSAVKAFSGDITETSDLGLPSLPASAGSAAGSDSSLASDLALITGSNSLRVYVDGTKNVRLQVLGSLSEQDVILHGDSLWTYDSKSNKAEHATITAPSTSPGQHFSRPGTKPMATTGPVSATPPNIAKELIAQLRATSTVSVDDDVRIAGRAAYDLVLTPNPTDTLIGSISIAVDAQTGLPLQVQIAAAGQKDPAVSIGFTSLDLSTPTPSLFEFTPPKGATVKELKTDGTKPKTQTEQPAAGAKPTETVTGSGWDAVVTVSGTSSMAASLSKLQTSPEYGELTTAVGDGRVFHTSLFTVLFTSDGRIVAGAVSVARLEAVAAQ